MDSIVATTEIPRQGEKWCKVMKFQLINCNDFLKNEQKVTDLINGVPKAWLEK